MRGSDTTSGAGQKQQYRAVNQGRPQPRFEAPLPLQHQQQAMLLPQLMTAMQKEEQFQAIQSKLSLKPSLTETCYRHEGQIVIFVKSSDQGLDTKYCEKCYQEEEKSVYDSAARDQPAQHSSDDTQPDSRSKVDSNGGSHPESKGGKIQELQLKIQSQLNTLSFKMQKKVEELNIRQQHLTMYQRSLTQMYNPVFHVMRQVVKDRELDYMTYLLKQLDQNKERIDTEKVSFDKLMGSFESVSDNIKSSLETQLKNIEITDKESQKIVAREESGEEIKEVSEPEIPLPPVDTYQVEALSTIVDDYENIINKNYCVYTNYEDFSFAQSRSLERLEDQFKHFVAGNFSGDYQLKNWFDHDVLPRIMFLQSTTKFLFTFKILHNTNECQQIQNAFQFPDKARHVVTPDGYLYVTGGFQHILKTFVSNTFILDDHRSTLIPLQRMNTARSDHAILYNRGTIYVFGGMNYSQVSTQTVKSLTSCESYSVKDDAWKDLPPMSQARQAFSVCLFNDKYVFAFGGKVLVEGASMKCKGQDYNFVTQVEVYDTDRNNWKVINYINEQDKLRVVYPGSFQSTGKKIIIFGGLKPLDSDHSSDKLVTVKDGSKEVIISNETLFLNVSTGEINRGTDLGRPSYYFSGGSVFPQNGSIHAFGFTTVKEHLLFQSALQGSQESTNLAEINSNQNKKTYHFYKVSEEKWQEVSEAVFTGYRKLSIDTLDETL